ncbi:MAG: hypothetical protein Aurels2KO_11530 [Aureliella sp.]
MLVPAYATGEEPDAQELLDKAIALAHRGNVGVAVLATVKNTLSDSGRIATKSSSFFSFLESPVNLAADDPLKLGKALLVKKEDSIDGKSRELRIAETFYVNDGKRARYSRGSGQLPAIEGLREIRLSGEPEQDERIVGQLKQLHKEFCEPIAVILLPQVFSQHEQLDIATLNRYYNTAVLSQWNNTAGVFGVWQFGIYKVEIQFASDTQLPVRLRWYRSRDGQELQRREQDRELLFENRAAWTKSKTLQVPKTIVTYMNGGVFARRKPQFESESRLDVVYRTVDKRKLAIDAEKTLRELDEGGPWQNVLSEMSDELLEYSEEAAPAFK